MNEPARVCRDTSSRINYDRFEASEHVHHARNPGCDCVCVDLCRKWSKSVKFGWSRPPFPGNPFAPFSNRAISILYRFLADRLSVRALIEAQMRSIRIIRYRIAQIPDQSRHSIGENALARDTVVPVAPSTKPKEKTPPIARSTFSARDRQYNATIIRELTRAEQPSSPTPSASL